MVEWEKIGAAVAGIIIGAGSLVIPLLNTRKQLKQSTEPWSGEDRRQVPTAEVHDELHGLGARLEEIARGVAVVTRDSENLLRKLDEIGDQVAHIPGVLVRLARVEDDWRRDHERLSKLAAEVDFVQARLDTIDPGRANRK